MIVTPGFYSVASMSFLRPNLVLRGIWQKATYTVLRLIRNDCQNVWLGKRYGDPLGGTVLQSLLICGSNDHHPVTLKEALNSQSYNAEANALNGYLRGHDSFRQLINLIPDQKIMVYEYLADNLHNVLYTRSQRKLEKEEVKRLTKVVLKGLATMHEEGIAHTGKLQNEIRPQVLSIMWLY